MTKVSVIIPVYNAEKTLERCLDALINQTFSDFEVICVNDGSKDNSWEVLEKYSNKDSRIKAFNLENHGVAYTRNFAISKMSGKYLMFCDADDWYEPSMIEEMVNTIEEQNVDVVMCDANVIDIANGTIQTEGDIKYHYLALKGFHQLKIAKLDQINVVIWNKIFKKEIIDKYGITYPDKYEHDDLAFVYKYFSVSKTFFGLDKKLYNYIIGNPNSIMGQVFTRSNKGKEFDFIYAFDSIFKFLKSCPNEEFFKYAINSFINLYLFYIGFLSYDKQKQSFEIIKSFINNADYFRNIKAINLLKKSKNLCDYYKNVKYSKLTLWEKIFSIKNEKNHKVIRILGLAFKIKRYYVSYNNRIFIAYHKPYALFKNDICTPIHCGRSCVMKNKDGNLSTKDMAWMQNNMIGDDTGNNISSLNCYLNEWTGIYWIWKNYETESVGNPDIIGLIHYRTMLMLDIYPSYDANYLESCGYKSVYISYLLRDKKAITGNWVTANIFNPRKTKIYDLTRSYKTHYESYKNITGGHNIYFYDKLFEILKTKFKKDYKSFYKWSMTPNKGGPFKNLFIMRKKDFVKLCNWIFPIIFEMLRCFKDYNYKDANESRNISWLTELLFAYYFDKYIGRKNCHETSVFRPIAESRELVEV